MPDEALLGHLCDDLNTASAIAHLHKLADVAKTSPTARTALGEAMVFFGFGPYLDTLAQSHAAAHARVDEAFVQAQISQREQARAQKDFARADAIRDELTQQGIELIDTPTGTSWRIIP